MNFRLPSIVKFTRPLVIPKSIDIDEIMRINPPSKRAVNRDCLIYLISLIYSKAFSHSKSNSLKMSGFVPLKMHYLNRKFHSARENLDYLISLNIIECDYNYAKNVTSYGYRLNKEYLIGETKQVFFQRRVNYDRIARSYDSQRHEIKVPDYLARPFEKNCISLDFKEANDILESVYEGKIADIYADDSLNEIEKNIEVNNIKYALSVQREAVSRICKNDFEGSYFIDDTSYRFHSLITTLKKEVRPLIKLDGFNTVSLDLKNSQPFFLLLLMKRAFYSNRNRERKILQMREIDIDNRYREYILNNINPLMIGKSAESIENTRGSVYEFCQAIRCGTLYELFMSKRFQINALQPHQYNQFRNEIKEQFLIFLYDEPARGYSKKSVKGIIKKEFPEIYEFIDHLKRFKTNEVTNVKHAFKRARNGFKLNVEVDSGFKMLSKLIQSIESKVMLDIVCSEIASKHPEMPFLTVHDSIIIPENYTKAVVHIMRTEIQRVTWELPQIKIE